jgi:hypothetical protein
MKHHDASETLFYDLYNSFEHLENDIWRTWLNETVATLENDEAYQGYAVREKLLAFYYTWLQKLLQVRSYANMKLSGMQKGVTPGFLKSFQLGFEEYMHELIVEGKDTHEVAGRPYTQYYPKGFWIQLMLIHQFWLKDFSQDFEQTDAFVEKSVHFSMDLVAKGAVDSFQDLAKFLITRKDFL